MKGKQKIPFNVGWTVKRFGGLDTGTVQQIREHLPVMIRVWWPSRTSNQSEWVPIDELVLASLPPNAARIAGTQEKQKRKSRARKSKWFSELPDC
jgi:hypothetical protein